MFTTSEQKLIYTDSSHVVHPDLQPYSQTGLTVDTFRRMTPGLGWFTDKMFYEHLIELNHTDRSISKPRTFKLTIDPILNLTMGKDMADSTGKKIYTNTRGFILKGALGTHIEFESAFLENQSVLPDYLAHYADSTAIIPGQGRWKTFKKNGYDYATAYGVLQIRAGKHLRIRLGHGKQKNGFGYRSLLLSDNAMNYPYIQFIANFMNGKLEYSQTYAMLMNLKSTANAVPGIEDIYQKKAASFQQLSFHPNKHFDAYLFQGLIAGATDSNYNSKLDAYYANPIIFTNLAHYGFNQASHILVGGGFEFRPTKGFWMYGQFAYDGSNTIGSNSGVQAGIKLFDLFKVKNLFFQVEVNRLYGSIYYNNTYFAENYTHYQQTLTTPAIFPTEAIGILSWSHKRFFIQAKGNFSTPQQSNFTEFSAYADGKIGYMINPKYKLNISLGTTVREFAKPMEKTQKMELFYISLRTSLYNLYYDF